MITSICGCAVKRWGSELLDNLCKVNGVGIFSLLQESLGWPLRICFSVGVRKYFWQQDGDSHFSWRTDGHGQKGSHYSVSCRHFIFFIWISVKRKKNKTCYVLLHSLILVLETTSLYLTASLCWFMSDLCPEQRDSRELLSLSLSFFFFLGMALPHMEVPRLGVELELKLLAYTAAHGDAGSLTHWAKPGIGSESLWILVRFRICWSTVGTPENFSSAY